MDLIKFEGLVVETLVLDGVVLFNPYDIGQCLDIKKTTVRDHIAEMDNYDRVKVKNFDVGNIDFRKLNNAGEVFITESGVYELVFKSRKPNAKAFKKWIKTEVLPSIQKTGGYAITPTLSIEAMHILVMQDLQQKVDKQRLELLDNRPAVVFSEAVSSAENSISVGQLAKILKQNGLDIGQNKLFVWLRGNQYLIKKGRNNNMPTQKSMDLKLFEVEETVFTTPTQTHTTLTTLVTGKGQIYFVNKFLKDM